MKEEVLVCGSLASHVTLRRTPKTYVKTVQDVTFNCNMVSSSSADQFSCMISPRLNP